MPALSQLAAAEADQLGGWRIHELDLACEALGVTDHRFLGGAGHYRDSGMMGLKENEHPRCFWQADVDDAAKLLLPVFDEVRPQVLVTYDTFGFYGHPDHIQAHRVAMRAAEMATDAGFGPAKIYWTTVSRSSIERGFEAFRNSADNPFGDAKSIDDIPFGTPDDEITARIDGRAQSARKSAAIDAHATQIPTDSWLRTVAGNQGAEISSASSTTSSYGARRGRATVRTAGKVISLPASTSPPGARGAGRPGSRRRRPRRTRRRSAASQKRPTPTATARSPLAAPPPAAGPTPSRRRPTWSSGSSV